MAPHPGLPDLRAVSTGDRLMAAQSPNNVMITSTTVTGCGCGATLCGEGDEVNLRAIISIPHVAGYGGRNDGACRAMA
jgi:hypothetical protein